MINKKTTWLIKGFSFYAMRKLVQQVKIVQTIEELFQQLDSIVGEL